MRCKILCVIFSLCSPFSNSFPNFVPLNYNNSNMKNITFAVALVFISITAYGSEIDLSGNCGKTENDYVTWTVEGDGVLTVSGMGAMADYASADEQPWYDYSSDITRVVVEDGVTSIGQSAFEECQLTSISLPEGLTTIGAKAFYNNIRIIEIVSIPQSVTSIGNSAFEGTSVQNFFINNIPSKIVIGTTPFEKDGVTIHVFTKMKSIFEYATNWSDYKGCFSDDIVITHVESVSLDIEDMIVHTNSTGKLNVTITPADARVTDVIFTSSNDDVVHITDAATGEFTAGNNEGNAIITCTALDGSGAFAICKIWVEKSFVPATSVSLNSIEEIVEVDETFQLKAHIDPGDAKYKNIFWRSSDKDVATVENGKVTAKAPGVATITAISGDGHARANCEVVVLHNQSYVIQGEFESGDDKPLEISSPIYVKKVTLKRSFSAGTPSTIMLPFDFTPDKAIGSFYTLASVAPDQNGVWTATMSDAVPSVKANTPYIFKAAKNLTELSFEDDNGITLQPTSTIEINTNGDWTLHGVYTKTMLDGEGQINYGFAGREADGIKVGDFIRAGEGVWADPMRCYLTYSGEDSRLKTKAATVLPDRIRVVFPDEVEDEPSDTEIVTPVTEIAKESGVKVWSYNKTVIIESQPGTDYTIVDLSGRIIKTGVTHSTHEEVIVNLSAGIVIVKINYKAFKVNL